MNRRLVGAAAAALLLPGCAAGSLVAYKLSPDHPDGKSEELRLPGLSAPVKVTFDALGIPHIEAENDLDLIRADGWAQGRARFFELDTMRRFARGRVSELVGRQNVLGGTTPEFDLQMRGWELEERAARDFAGQSAAERAPLEAFAAGVNAALAEHEPIEYRLLRVKPEPWRPEDSLAVGLLNAWSVSHNWQQELTRFVLAVNAGLDRASALYPHDALASETTLPNLGDPRDLPPGIAAELEPLFREHAWTNSPASTTPLPPHASRQAADATFLSGASNAWVLSGARSTSGKPLLANDPHLSHLVPSIVFQHHLKTPEVDVIGITVPGMPWVIAGHNQRVAWGMTSTVADVIDLVVEQPHPSRPNEVVRESGTCALTRTEVEVRIREGDEFVTERHPLRRTCTGPVINDLYPHLLPANAPLLSIRWKVDGVEKSVSQLGRAARANNVAELQASLGTLASPVGTVQAADVEGHIAVFLTGNVPQRLHHRGTFPIPGWLAKYEWAGSSDTFGLPHGLDPAKGWFAHGNNQMQDPRYTPGTFVCIDAAPGYRVERIGQLIEAKPKHDAASLTAIQADVFSLRAKRVAPFIHEELAGMELTGAAAKARELLAAWDFDAKADSAATLVFFETYRRSIESAMVDELDAAGFEFFVAQRYSTNIADGWFERSDHPVWDDRRTPTPELRQQHIRAAFLAAVEGLSTQLGPEPTAWRWGALHKLSPRHAFGGQSAVASMVNLPEHEAGGELDSVWKSHFDLGNRSAPYKVVAGPVFRMVVDLADLAHAKWVIDTGSSGWPKSPHYEDQYAAWRRGELLPMVFDPADVARDATATVRLSP